MRDAILNTYHVVLNIGASILLLLFACKAHAQAVHAWEGTLAIPTYQLGPADPNPPFALVNPHPVYPYPMLDDLGDKLDTRTYRALYLENQYLRITILPELGGHVYSVYDKIDHREVLYRNSVIKYGLVGPRGAWIAGGMEFSFPYAHTTDTVSRVQSVLRQNSDGSATAMVGAIDWVSNMYWQIGITLRPNTARLEEGVTLFNDTPVNHLYLFWTNTAVKATDDMQYVYPMRETISDDPFAIVQSWPVWKGVDQSWYKNDPSAMAIFARDVQRNFFGVYYHQSNYGVAHVADFRQDPGKKVWSWGTAPSGKIWDHILSDDNGSYNEIQSGRFATQGYREFMSPHRVERWTEYWYPVTGLDSGFVEAASSVALNTTFIPGSGSAGDVKVLLSPAADMQDTTLTLRLGSKVLRNIPDISLSSLHPVSYTVFVQNLDQARKEINVRLQSSHGKELLAWSASSPVDGNADLVPSVGQPLQAKITITAQTPLEELYLNGVFQEKRGDLPAALKTYDQVLHRDPHFTPALQQEAFHAYQAAAFPAAERLVAEAQERDNENPAVAYAAGVIYRADGRYSLARNAFWTALHYGDATSPGRTAESSFLQLGEIALREGNYADAVTLCKRATSYNEDDTLALADLAVAERLAGDGKGAAVTAAEATRRMPLLPFALAEQWQDQSTLKDEAATITARQAWIQAIGSDPQNYLAVAAWYHDIGAWRSSDSVLQEAIISVPAQDLSPMVFYYLASNSRQEGVAERCHQYEARASSLSAAAVFPNRLTDAAVLAEAVRDNVNDAQARYALGNFLFAHARYKEASQLWLESLDLGFNDPVLLRNLGVYQWRVKHNLASAAGYYARAISLRPKDYRLYTDIDAIYEEQGNLAARADLFRNAPAAVLNRDTVLARRALLLIEQHQPDKALALLLDHRFKPWEGGVVIHNLFVFANMQKGKQALAIQKPEQAAKAFREAMEYPDNLGTGQPSEPELAEQLYWLGIALEEQGNAVEARTAWQTAVAQGDSKDDMAAALAYRKLGKQLEARRIADRCIQKAAQPDATADDYVAAAKAESFRSDPDRARQDLHRALELEPLLWQARIALAQRNHSVQISQLPQRSGRLLQERLAQ